MSEGTRTLDIFLETCPWSLNEAEVLTIETKNLIFGTSAAQSQR